MNTRAYIRHWAGSRIRRRYRGPLVILLLLLILGVIGGLWLRKAQLQRQLLEQEAQYMQAGGQMSKQAARIRLDSFLLYGNTEQATRFLDRAEARLDSADLRHARQALRIQEKRRRRDSLQESRLQSSSQQKVQRWRDSLNDLQQNLRQQVDSARMAIQAQNREIRELQDSLRTEPERQFVEFYNQKGNRVYYLGDVKDGKAHGKGVGIWKTGSVYQGQWKNNRRHGKGTFEWKDGERYKGEYRQGMRHGKGTYYWTNGEKFVGQWRNDQRNGSGVFYDREGEVMARGRWENDELVERK